MARPQEFNQQQVIAKAIECFWFKGYSETSLADLLAAMKLSRSSFYNNFGDKRQLFELCLHTYAEQTKQLLSMTLLNDNAAPIEAIRQFFNIVLIAPAQELSAKGCLLVNTIAESAKVDLELNQLAGQLMQPVKEGFIHQLRKELDEQASIQYGEWLFTQLLGWRLQCQLGLEKRILEQQIHWTLKQLSKKEELC